MPDRVHGLVPVLLGDEDGRVNGWICGLWGLCACENMEG